MNPTYHFNYQALDEYLSSESDPKEIARQLDQSLFLMMKDQTESPSNEKADDFHNMRQVRNIFWQMIGIEV